jgi:hypothetical protein
MGALGTIATNVASELAIMALSALKDLGKEMIESYTSASKLSESIGITAESIVGLRYAADLSKVGAEEMDKNLVTLSKSIADAASGSSEAADSFEKMGISVKNADGTTKNSNKVLMEMADVFKDMPAGVDRVSLAVEVFGENGASMVNMLKDGSDGLREMVDEGTAAAGNIEGIAEAMTALDNAGTRAKAVIMGMMATLADTAPFKAAIGYLDTLSKEWANFARERKAAVEQGKEIERLEKDGAMADIKVLENRRMQLDLHKEYVKVSEKERVKMLEAIDTQIESLKKKNNISETEIDLMKAGGRIAALNSKAKIIALSDEEKLQLDCSQSIVNRVNAEKEMGRQAEENAKAERAAIKSSIAGQNNKKKAIEDTDKAAKKAAEEMAREEAKRIADEVKEFDDAMKKKEAATKSLADFDETMRIKGLEGEEQKIAQLEANYEKQMAEIAALHEAQLLYAEDRNAILDAQADRELEIGAQLEADKQAIHKKEMERLDMENQQRIDAVAGSLQCMQQIFEGQKKYAALYKIAAVGEATINAAQSVLKAMTAAPPPFNIALAVAQAAAAAVQVGKISSAKMYRGGMIPGKNTLIMANEDGLEAILNPMAVRAVGGPAGVNALNQGTNNYSYDNSQSQNNTVVINTTLLSQTTWRNDIEPALRWREKRR